MGAVFTLFISIGGEGLTAISADIALFRFLINLVLVGVPPQGTADIRAEALMLPSSSLRYSFSALLAGGGGFTTFPVLNEAASSAVGLNGVD